MLLIVEAQTNTTRGVPSWRRSPRRSRTPVARLRPASYHVGDDLERLERQTSRRRGRQHGRRAEIGASGQPASTRCDGIAAAGQRPCQVGDAAGMIRRPPPNCFDRRPAIRSSAQFSSIAS